MVAPGGKPRRGILWPQAFTDDGPQAKAFLTYGNTADRSDPAYTEATQRFSDKEWRTVLFRADDVTAGAIETTTVRG